MKQKVNIPGGTYYLMNKKIMELKIGTYETQTLENADEQT
jgi:hypothetical protein